jgi:hypothetical protein
MNETVSKAQKRHLRHQVGSAAAEAVVEMKNTVTRVELAQQVLARQMLDFEVMVAQTKEARAVDLRALAAMREQLESAHARVSDERTHRLNLANEQRAYVDRGDKELRGRVNHLCVDVVELSGRFGRFQWMTLLQRLRWLVTGQLPTAPKESGEPHIASDAYDAAWADLGRPAEP